jgi:hypothetical protein
MKMALVDFVVIILWVCAAIIVVSLMSLVAVFVRLMGLFGIISENEPLRFGATKPSDIGQSRLKNSNQDCT